jgi:hypothetical protein
VPLILSLLQTYLKDEKLGISDIELYLCRKNRLESVLELNKKTDSYRRRNNKMEEVIEENNDACSAVENAAQSAPEGRIQEGNTKDIPTPPPPVITTPMPCLTWNNLPAAVESGDCIIIQRYLPCENESVSDGDGREGEEKYLIFPHDRNTVEEYQRCSDYFMRISIRDKLAVKVRNFFFNICFFEFVNRLRSRMSFMPFGWILDGRCLFLLLICLNCLVVTQGF